MRFRCPAFLVLLLCFVLVPAAPGEETEAGPPAVACTRALLLGPLAAEPQAPATGELRGDQALVPEIVAERFLPAVRQGSWRAAEAGPEGAFAVEGPGVYWIAARLRADGPGEVDLSLAKGSALYGNGEELAAKGPGETGDPLEAAVDPAGGWVTIYGRVILGEDDGGIRLTASSADAPGLAWTLEAATPWTRFEDTDQVPRISGLALADGSRFLARKLFRRSDDTNRLDVLNREGALLAARAFGPGAGPVGFLPMSAGLILREGPAIWLWDIPTGYSRALIEDEPGLGWVKITPNGRYLMFVSDRGFDEKAPADGPGRRYTDLRERVTDYAPTGHLHLYDLPTGVRRVLTRPGDFALDDAAMDAKGTFVVYGRTVPIPERPWFSTEIRRIELNGGQDTLLAVFTSGWEVRPQTFALDPDGTALFFIGPPDQIGGYGEKKAQHNVYNKQVWRLGLQDGKFERLTGTETFAFDGGSGLPRFLAPGRLLVKAQEGPRNRLAVLEQGGDRWSTTVLPMHGENLQAVAVSPDGRSVAYTASSPDRPGALYLADLGSAGALLENPAADLQGRTLWSPAQEMSFTGPGGQTIDAWFHPPLTLQADGSRAFAAPAQGKAPLIVYYYGGSAATLRTFNTTFQFLAANGYGLLAVNPRGAAGWGARFADRHAGDWGPEAAADVLAATKHVLKQRPWLDEAAIGIYGGSYGGFMTNYLVTHSDMFAAAVSMYGISDLATYWGQGAWGITYGDMALGGRSPWNDPKYFLERSPLFAADQVKTPLLLLHGDADANVTPGESIQLFNALSALGKPVEMVLFPGEDHGISGSWENRVAHRTMMLEWFDKWLKDRPEAWEKRWE